MARSQAALEFLTTYAWAFLVIIIMVGALAYFGVLSPSKLLPDRCNFGSEIGCNKDTMVVKKGTSDNIQMRLENNFGAQVTIPVDGITITTDVAAITACPTITMDTTTMGTTAYTWPSDGVATLKATCTGGDTLVQKEKIKFSIEIKYFPTAATSTYTKIVFGEVFTTIQ